MLSIILFKLEDLGRMPKVHRVCKNCKVDFFVYPSHTKKEGTGVFCSKRCHFEYKTASTRIARICETCGTEFFTTPSRLRYAGARFCSRKCRDVANRRRVEKTCENCGQMFEEVLNRLKTGRGKYCSLKCANEWRAKNDPKGPANKFWKRVTKVCETCGGEFMVKAHRVTSARFCSCRCYGSWKKTDVQKANNPNWKSGKSFEPYPLAFDEEFRESIRKRDERACAVCRLSGLDVHHIDYDKSRTIPENCVTLCRSCHAVTNWNREYWEQQLESLVKARQMTMSPCVWLTKGQQKEVVYNLIQIGRPW